MSFNKEKFTDYGIVVGLALSVVIMAAIAVSML